MRAKPVALLLAPLALAATLPLAAQERERLSVRRTPEARATARHLGALEAYVPPPPVPTIPPVVGLPRDEAIVVLRRRDFFPEIRGEEPSREFPPGSVARQEPPGNSPVPPGQRVVRLWLAVPPPPETVVWPVETETPTPEPPPPTPDDRREGRKLPPTYRIPPPSPTATRPFPVDPWTVAVVVAGAGALAYAVFRVLRPKDGGKESASRAPEVHVEPRRDDGEQSVVSSGPVTSGLTLHPVTDPGEQMLEVSGPLLREGREP